MEEWLARLGNAEQEAAIEAALRDPWRIRSAAEPCPDYPGTVGKWATLILRYEQGLSLWHPLDAVERRPFSNGAQNGDSSLDDISDLE